jgi:hypothetical protein
MNHHSLFILIAKNKSNPIQTSPHKQYIVFVKLYFYKKINKKACIIKIPGEQTKMLGQIVWEIIQIDCVLTIFVSIAYSAYKINQILRR